MKKLFLTILIPLLLCAQQPSHFVQGGQQAVTGSAAQLPSFIASAICITVAPGGTQTVYLGGSAVTTSNGFPLAAGAGTCFPIQNLNQLYVIAASTGSTVAWYGLQN